MILLIQCGCVEILYLLVLCWVQGLFRQLLLDLNYEISDRDRISRVSRTSIESFLLFSPFFLGQLLFRYLICLLGLSQFFLNFLHFRCFGTIILKFKGLNFRINFDSYLFKHFVFMGTLYNFCIKTYFYIFKCLYFGLVYLFHM